MRWKAYGPDAGIADDADPDGEAIADEDADGEEGTANRAIGGWAVAVPLGDAAVVTDDAVGGGEAEPPDREAGNGEAGDDAAGELGGDEPGGGAVLGDNADRTTVIGSAEPIAGAERGSAEPEVGAEVGAAAVE
ncbi:hypothetical protein SAMN05892883_0562 [Jatrophihabitans sp. GAS493]|uniref:hypothetical protein n=1 Tax=Jatrophihabitans sp. GAS493 TaxID=1907575 RepID=UPI000BB712A4|nr:hypothetical protein [Jatrophihabitans sp. GAS493]SOD70941.1 hypothetical protein SAMN05892883_0562 [Jatrophihabitans sp. GAS493]